MAASPDAIVYSVDRDERLRVVTEESWLRFARENDAAKLTPQQVRDRMLWDFVAGEEVRHVYRWLFVRVRSLGVEVRVPVRCDSPGTQRFMELVLAPLEDRAIQITSVLLHQRELTEDAFVYVRPGDAERMLFMCSWCQRVQVGASWVDLELAAGRVPNLPSPVPVTNERICPDCYDSVRRAS